MLFKSGRPDFERWGDPRLLKIINPQDKLSKTAEVQSSKEKTLPPWIFGLKELKKMFTNRGFLQK
jgi:hypothetical protein